MPQLRVAIVCPGLGIADRGFERASRDAFEALREEPSLDVHLVKGRGPRAGRELVAPTVSRESRIAKAVAHRRGRHDFWLEQLVFSATVQPHLLRLRPDVVMLGEWTLTVNPFDVEGQAQAIHEALVMDRSERKRRLDAIRTHVREHDVNGWLDIQFAALDRVATTARR